MPSWKRLTAQAAVGCLGMVGLLTSAHAGNVYWSIGVHQPGVHVGVSNTPPVVHAPVVVHAPRHRVAPPHAVGWVPPGHRGKHAKPHRHQQVTHVTQVIHHHHYHGVPPRATWP